ncbi:MmcQ/YjbR family DNA-binding protein [Candidatus Saccharibacteria bacterium]|nr:MmcQ/YjbR family DNA-binding protein [Candidatus Saccharibacteria bacterium]
MKYDWFEKYATSKKGARKEYKPEWEVDRYMIRDKMFIMHGGDKEGKEIITLKLEPSFGQFLREQFPGEIVPGYYMNKDHWNSVYVDGNVPDEVLRDIIDKSYESILGAFSKKVKEEILGDE